MTKRVALYARRTSPGEPLPINITPVPLPDGTPTDLEERVAAGELSNGWSGGASKMRAEHVKEWLQGVRREEDPEQNGYEGAGDPWRLLMKLVTAVPATGLDHRRPDTQRRRRLPRNRPAGADLEDH